MSDTTKKLTLILDSKVTSAVQGIQTVSSKLEGVASKITNAFGGMGGLAGIVSVGGAVKVLGDVARKGEDISEGARKIGVTTDEYQRLTYVAEQCGAGAGSVESAFKRMNNVLFGVDEESKKAQHTIGLLGLSIDDLGRKSPEQKFAAIAAALRGIKDPVERAALGMQIFGRESQSLIPMINEYDELKGRLEEVGGLMSGKNVEAAEKFSKSIRDLTKSFQALIMDSGIIAGLEKIGESLNATQTNPKNAKKAGVSGFYGEQGYWGALLEGTGNALTGGYYSEWMDKAAEHGGNLPRTESWKSSGVEKEFKDKKDAKALADSEAAKAAQIRADAQALSASEEQVKGIMKGLDGREKEKKAVENIVSEMQNQIKVQDLIAAGKEKEAYIQNEIYKAQKSHAEIPMSDEQRKTIADSAIKLPENERQAFVESEFDKFSKSRPENTLTPDENKKISGLADTLYTSKANQATNEAMKEMQEQLRLQLLINDGKGKQAFIDETLAKFAKDRGEALDAASKISIGDTAGKLYDLKNQFKQDKEPVNYDSLTKLGLYNFGTGGGKNTLDVERNGLLKQIAEKIGIQPAQTVLA